MTACFQPLEHEWAAVAVSGACAGAVAGLATAIDAAASAATTNFLKGSSWCHGREQIAPLWTNISEVIRASSELIGRSSKNLKIKISVGR